MSSAPRPLTAPSAPDLDWARVGMPASRDYNDIYFSVDGGLEETKAVFLDACGLPERWLNKKKFTIGELGFGSGLNFLATWNLWEKTAKPDQRLHFISIEAFPWSCADLNKALAFWPSLKANAQKLIGAWPGRVKGVHRLHFGNVTLTLFHEHIDRALPNIDARMDAWFLDGFSPSKNPDMWSDHVFGNIARLSNAGARIGTFTVAGNVRRGLSKAGFDVQKKPGFGRKRERLEAVYTGKAPAPESIDQPIIIGGGIAGASIAHAFLRRGITPILIDPHRDLKTAASGNPVGLVMPRLDLQDRPESRFFLSAYLYALAHYQEHGNILDKGILHMASREKEGPRFRKIIKNQALPQEQMKWVDAVDAATIFGQSITANAGGLYFPNALVISPVESVLALTQNCDHIPASAHKISYENGRWQVEDCSGAILAQTKALFVCNGANILDIFPADVRFTNGQICWGMTQSKPKSAIIAGNYTAPFQEGVLLGASHTHVGAGENNETQFSHTDDIIEQYKILTGAQIDEKEWQSRAAVRVTTKDTLPIACPVQDGLYVMSGLGSRGLMMAPLLGEALACTALGEAVPLSKSAQARFSIRNGNEGPNNA